MAALVTNGQGSANNNPTTGSLDTTGATLLVAVVTYSGTVTGVTDSKGNTWTALTAHANAGVTSRIYYVDSATPTVGTGHTFTLNGTGIAGAINVMAFSGTTASPFQAQTGSNAGSGSTIQPGSVTPTYDGCIVVTGFTGGNTFGGSGSINSSFSITNQKALTGGVNYGTAAAYLIQSTAAAVNPTWTLGSTVSNIASTIAVFNVAGAAGFYKATVKSADVPGTLTNYPAYIDLDRLGIDNPAEANSIRVYSDQSKTTELAREIVSKTQMWVKIPSLTNTFTVYVDWNGVRADYAVTDTYGRNAVWSDYARVYHLEEGSGNRTDSTGNVVLTGTTRGAVAGAIGNGNDFEESSADYLNSANTGLVNVSNISIELIFRAESFTDTYPVLASVFDDSTDSRAWAIALVGSNLYFYVSDNGANSGMDQLASAVLSTGTNYFVTCTFEGLATSNFNTYINTTNYNKTSTTANSVANETTAFRIGTAVTFAGAPTANYWDGWIDEVRIRTGAVLSANWDTTKYHNLSDEADFWGTWSDVGGATFIPRISFIM